MSPAGHPAGPVSSASSRAPAIGRWSINSYASQCSVGIKAPRNPGSRAPEPSNARQHVEILPAELHTAEQLRFPILLQLRTACEPAGRITCNPVAASCLSAADSRQREGLHPTRTCATCGLSITALWREWASRLPS